jgi:hypothetical protein
MLVRGQIYFLRKMAPSPQASRERRDVGGIRAAPVATRNSLIPEPYTRDSLRRGVMLRIRRLGSKHRKVLSDKALEFGLAS